MSKLTWAIVAVIVIGGGFYLSHKSTVTQEGGPLRLGGLLILSGELANPGEASKRAIDMAIEDWNADTNHRKAEIIYEDTKAEAKTAITAYQKLVSIDKVDAIIGPLLLTETSALIPLISQGQVPVVTVTPIPKDYRGKVFNPLGVWADPTLEAEQMAQYVFDQGARTVSAFGTQDAWENEVSDAFSAKFATLGGKVLDKEIVLPDSKDTSLAVTKAINGNPDALFIGTYYKFVYFVKKVKELGYKGKLYSIEADPYLAADTKPFSNGLQFISPEFYSADFLARFKAKYGLEPSIPAGQAYDAVMILLSTLQKSKSPAEAIAELKTITSFQGASGMIKFNQERSAQFPMSLFEMKDGKMFRIK